MNAWIVVNVRPSVWSRSQVVEEETYAKVTISNNNKVKEISRNSRI